MNIRPRLETGAAMRIDPSTSYTPLTTGTASGAASTAGTARTASAGEAAAVAETGFSPTADLTRLIQLVKDIPDIRADVIQEVLAKAEAGDLTSQQAALDTAAAVIDSKVLAGD
jgi:hypothetical protein